VATVPELRNVVSNLFGQLSVQLAKDHSNLAQSSFDAIAELQKELNNRINGVVNSISNVNSSNTADIPPSDVTDLFASWIFATPAPDGTPQVQVTVTFTAPSGTFKGVEIFIDHPDVSDVGLSIADGTTPTDGTLAAQQPFNPDDKGYFAKGNPIQFMVPAPKEAEAWRVYAQSKSDTITNALVENGLPNETPSFQITVLPAPTATSGREYAPNVEGPILAPVPSGWAANPNIVVPASGDQYFQVAFQWAWPDGDHNFAQLGGIDLMLDDGFVKRTLASVSAPNDTFWASEHIPVLPGTTHYTMWFVSFDTSGHRNSIIPGVTPSVLFDVIKQTGPAGAEFCLNPIPAPVDPAANTPNDFLYLVTEEGADGTSLLRVIMNFTAPNDLSYGGAEIVVLKDDGKYYSVASGRLAPIEKFISQPASVKSWTFYLRGIDVNGNRNTIVNGVTPAQTINVGTTSGLLNLGKANDATFSTEFTITPGGVFEVGSINVGTKGTGFGTEFSTSSGQVQMAFLDLAKTLPASISSQFAITTGVLGIAAISAGIITTGILQVGGGGNKVSKLTIFETLGSLIGWIGDDTGSSGFVGAWFKQVRIGGTGPSGAPIQADSSGVVTINGAKFTMTGGGGDVLTLDPSAAFGNALTIVGGSGNTKMSSQNCTFTVGSSFAEISASAVVVSAPVTGWTVQSALTNGILQLGNNTTLGVIGFQINASAPLVASTATAGSAALPANPSGFLIVTIAGVTQKIPYYNN
jgi:hypothetical protein